MKKITKKRLTYYNPVTNELCYGGEEYDGSLSDEAILNAIHTIGKTTWIWGHAPYSGKDLWLLRPDPRFPNILSAQYRIEVEEYVMEIPTRWDKWLKKIKRALI